MSTHTIGIDLAVSGEHKAIVADEQGRFLTSLCRFATVPAELDHLLASARSADTDGELQAVMEPTGMAWLPVAAYLARRKVRVYLAPGQQVADLRKFYKRHAKSDRIDARVLAKLPVVNDEHLHPMILPTATALACQRACRQRDRLVRQMTAIRNRLLAIDRFAWPGLQRHVFRQPFAAAACWFRESCYDPLQVLRAGADTIRQAWCASQLDTQEDGAWSVALVKLAAQVLALYGPAGDYLDYAQLQGEVSREQAHLRFLREQEHDLRLRVIRPLYRRLHPSRQLESLKGVGQESAAVYASYIGDPTRFASLHAFRGWTGMVPGSNQSSERESKGLHITQAGPDLVKKFAYLDADVARLYDPQIAALYYDQMVHKGKHHNQALCACAAHLLERVLVVLREQRPYELRDVDGQPVSDDEARAIIDERYRVPQEVRQRTNKRARQERRERKTERKTKRESRPS